VAQDTSSSFDPRRTLRDAVRVPVQRLCGLDSRAADERVDRTLELLGLSPALAARRPAEVSGGQRQRFALARALVVEPRLLVCDEVVSALDVSVQGSILNLLKRYCRGQQAGLAFVSHGLPAAAFIADDLAVMHRGRLVEMGDTGGILDHPGHPYTASLLQAHRGRPEGGRTSIAMGGDPERAQWACKYASACSLAVAACEMDRPVLISSNGRSVACHERMDSELVLNRSGGLASTATVGGGASHG
jgi:oligopeptide/dipeptide ABC transporter ATP-binding protein